MARRPTEYQYRTLVGLQDGDWHAAAALVGQGLDESQVRRALRSLTTFGRVERREEGRALWCITALGRQELGEEQAIRLAEAALRERL